MPLRPPLGTMDTVALMQTVLKQRADEQNQAPLGCRKNQPFIRKYEINEWERMMVEILGWAMIFVFIMT
jgi:hypothetical protein